ncbi:MAG: proline dehydrogenase family protein, partial [Hyphomicrobiales bacterium]
MATRVPGRKTPAREQDIEAAIQARGRSLLEDVEPERLITLSPAWWQERLMAWATADPDFRVKLLRFVDVLPTLRTAGAVADHVRQYFRGDTPLPVRLGSSVAGSAAFRPALSKVVRQGVFAMADRFIGGSSPEEALPKLRTLNEDGTAYTIDLLGEATLSEQEADAYLARYMELIAVLARSRPNRTDRVLQPNVSVKLSALTSHFEPAAPAQTTEAVKARLLPLLRAARASGVFVNIDMEQYRFKELTHYIYRDVLLGDEFQDWEDTGIVVQAYLRDAAEDVERLRELAAERGTPLTVRLVKGAYWDEEVIVAEQEVRDPPVFLQKEATDANYERCTETLVEAYPHLRPAFGTHNPRTIAQAMVRVERAAIPQEDAEFQMLYGMAEGLRKAVQAQGYRTRVYVPAGEIIPGMAYLVRRLLENTSNQSWLMHRHEEGDPAELLAVPEVAQEPAPPVRPDAFTNFPTAEFYRPEVREAMERALDQERARFGRDYPMLLGREAVSGRQWDVVTAPADPGLVLGRVVRGSVADADAAVAHAREGLERWRRTPAADRARILARAADLLAERRWEFAATMVFESSKPWRESDGDVAEAVDYLRYYGREARRMADGVALAQVAGEQNAYVYEPRGVTAVIAPWNFPLAIITGMSSAALAAGCSAILKPAEQSPIVAAKLVALLREAGVPGGVVQYLPGRGEDVGK